MTKDNPIFARNELIKMELGLSRILKDEEDSLDIMEKIFIAYKKISKDQIDRWAPTELRNENRIRAGQLKKEIYHTRHLMDKLRQAQNGLE